MMFSSKNKDSRGVAIGGGLILLIGSWFFFQSFRGNTEDDLNSERNRDVLPIEENQTIPTLSDDVIRQKILNNEKVRFLDLRDAESFKQEHIPHSLPLSPGTLESFIPEPDELLIIVLSTNDFQTLEVVKNSMRKKSTQIFLLAGGFQEWKKNGNQTISYGDPNSIFDQSKVTYITQTEIINAPNDFIILDVQSETNYQKKHVKGALHIPLDQLERRSTEIPAATDIIVYGESELVSFQGAVRLAGLNIISVKALRGNDHLKAESIFLLEP